MMKFAVVILNWNGKALVEKFLPSVMAHSYQAQIYVADNASTDDSIDFLEREYPQVKIIQNPNNYGYAKGYNEAAKNLNEPHRVRLTAGVKDSEDLQEAP